MSTFIVRGRHIVTMNAHRRVIDDGAVVVTDDVIVDVDQWSDIQPKYPDAVVVGDASTLVIPGMINTHQHLTGDRLVHSMIPDTIDSQEAIFGWAVPVHSAHTADDDHLSALLALNDALCNGITTTVEAGTVAHPEAVLRAQRTMGTRGTLGSWGWDVADAPWAGSVNEVLDRQREVLRLAPVGGLIEGWVTLVGHDLMSDELVCAASQLAVDAHTHLTFHISPSANDTASYLARTGRHPVEHLHHLGALGPHVLLAHAVHLTEHEVDCVVDSGAAVAVCPWAYLRLAQGITVAGRHLEMVRRGVRVGLGCDSENAGDAIDPLRNAALFAGLLRDREMDPAAFSGAEALAHHTIEAARAIGMDDRIGSLEVGKQADLVLLATDGPEWLPPSPNPVLQLVWAANGSSVRDVWVAGRQVVRNRRSTAIDAAAAAEEAIARRQKFGVTVRPNEC